MYEMNNFVQRIARLSPKKQELLGRLFEQEQLDFARVVITPRKRSASVPLSFAQQRLWFLDQLEPNSAVYNIPDTHCFNGPLKLHALERSLNEIVRRHEILRTTFHSVAGEPVQVIAEARPQPLAVIDLSALPQPERAGASGKNGHRRDTATIRSGARAAVSVSAAAAGRGTAHPAADDAPHHLGWLVVGSTGTGVGGLYQAYSTGQSSPLAELGIQYADFAVWQREWLQGEVLEKQLAYWREQLGGELPVLELPIDRPRPPQADLSRNSRRV